MSILDHDVTVIASHPRMQRMVEATFRRMLKPLLERQNEQVDLSDIIDDKEDRLVTYPFAAGETRLSVDHVSRAVLLGYADGLPEQQMVNMRSLLHYIETTMPSEKKEEQPEEAKKAKRQGPPGSIGYADAGLMLKKNYAGVSKMVGQGKLRKADRGFVYIADVARVVLGLPVLLPGTNSVIPDGKEVALNGIASNGIIRAEAPPIGGGQLSPG